MFGLGNVGFLYQVREKDEIAEERMVKVKMRQMVAEEDAVCLEISHDVSDACRVLRFSCMTAGP